MPGITTHRNITISLDDFRKLAQESGLLKNDLSGFRSNSGNYYYYGSHTGETTISGMIGINFYNKETESYNTNPQLRIGLLFMNNISFSSWLSKTELEPYDTLTSSQTGQTFIVDSVHTKNYNIFYNADQIHLSFSLIWRTNPVRLASLYAGIGIFRWNFFL